MNGDSIVLILIINHKKTKINVYKSSEFQYN